MMPEPAQAANLNMSSVDRTIFDQTRLHVIPNFFCVYINNQELKIIIPSPTDRYTRYNFNLSQYSLCAGYHLTLALACAGRGWVSTATNISGYEQSSQSFPSTCYVLVCHCNTSTSLCWQRMGFCNKLQFKDRKIHSVLSQYMLCAVNDYINSTSLCW